jgi:hypothetical protein
VILAVFLATISTAQPQLHLDSDLVFGEVDGSEALTRVSDLIIGRQGTVWFTQPREGGLLRFDPETRSLLRVGGRGQGPGEFLDMTAVSLVGDSIAVTDLRQQRISVFDLDGGLIRTSRLSSIPATPPFLFSGPYLPAQHGRIVVFGGAPMIPGRVALPHRPVALVSGGEVVRTLGNVSWGDRRKSISLGDRNITISRRLHLGSQFDIDPQGRWMVTATPAASFVDGSGDVDVVVQDLETGKADSWTIGVPVSPVSDAMRTEMTRVWAEFFQTTRQQQAELLEGLDFPAYWPPTAIQLDSSGRIWMRVADFEGLGRWIVADRAGNVLFTVLGPPQLTVFDSEGDRVWGVTRDDLDVQRVERFLLTDARDSGELRP